MKKIVQYILKYITMKYISHKILYTLSFNLSALYKMPIEHYTHL